MSPTPIQLEKAPTHISGVDEILHGGLPRGRMIVLKGGPGAGKTIFGMEFLYRGALAGEPGIFVGLEETAAQLRENAATLGWDLSALEENGQLFLLEGRLSPDTILSGDFSLKGLLAAIAGKSKEMNAQRLVLDALDVLLRLIDAPHRVRSEMHALNHWITEAGITTLMTIRPQAYERALAYEAFFDSMADCVIELDARVRDQITTRRFRVVKYRGSAFGHNEYPYIISPAGIQIVPITSVELRHAPPGERMTTGIEELDAVMGGGYRRATCILIAGPPGTGKTIMTSTFVDAACQRGEKVLYISFEESVAALTGNLLSAGLDLAPHIEAGRLSFIASFPEAEGSEEHLMHFLNELNAFDPQHVVVDAISACERIAGMQAAFEYLMRLLNICKERGSTVILTNQLGIAEESSGISGNGISSMVDTVILLSYLSRPDRTDRMLHVLKSRGSGHSNLKREYMITDEGIQIMGVSQG